MKFIVCEKEENYELCRVTSTGHTRPYGPHEVTWIKEYWEGRY